MPKKRKKNIMFKKIHFGYSLFAIFLLSIIPATLYLFVFLTIMETRQVSAAGVGSFGGEITTVKECILDTPAISPITCASSCPLCTGIMGGGCSVATEIAFRPFGGIWSFVCPNKAFIYRGGKPRPQGLIFGYGTSQSAPSQIGVSR